jgi:predicted enzyme related to lactoylglutathione lyase
MRWVEITPPGGNTRLTLLFGEQSPAWEPDRIGKTIATTFEVSDFESTCATLKNAGVAFKKEPKKEFYGWWAEINDSEGNVLGLHGEM